MTEGDTTARPDKRRRQGAWSLAMARQFEAALGGDCPVGRAGLIPGAFTFKAVRRGHPGAAIGMVVALADVS